MTIKNQCAEEFSQKPEEQKEHEQWYKCAWWQRDDCIQKIYNVRKHH
jgi:hypothetical protein